MPYEIKCLDSNRFCLFASLVRGYIESLTLPLTELQLFCCSPSKPNCQNPCPIGKGWKCTYRDGTFNRENHVVAATFMPSKTTLLVTLDYIDCIWSFVTLNSYLGHRYYPCQVAKGWKCTYRDVRCYMESPVAAICMMSTHLEILYSTRFWR